VRGGRHHAQSQTTEQGEKAERHRERHRQYAK
jgi:hypothetical protein